MQAGEIRTKFLNFFVSKGHKIIRGASLMPENDPSVLFTTAGMHPLVTYLMGEKHPEGKRLADAQKCVRTGDIDEVGDAWHLSFFEMLGNWSLGDYFKKEAVEWSFEFLTDKKWLGINPKQLYVTVFKGDNDAFRDENTIDLWQKLFAKFKIKAEVWENGEVKKEDRIFLFGKKDNWWGPAGKTGPCGPDTEMFFDTGKEKCNVDCKPGCGCGKFVEIWNDVFMEYNKNKDGKYEALEQKNVDTGMGLERMTAVMQGKNNVYDTELFLPIIAETENLSGKKYGEPEENTKAMRIIADHLRAAVFILGDERGIIPSNVEQGYILRRFVRRAVRYGKMIGIKENFIGNLSLKLVEIYKEIYPELEKKKTFIFDELNKEEEKFRKTLEKGLKILTTPKLTGKWFFDLYQSHGFPFEMAIEELKKVMSISQSKIVQLNEEFLVEMKSHQDLSRTASAGMFKGGLADAGEETKKLHTAAHLLLQALRDVLGDHIFQKGSNITAERLRFDFSHPSKMSSEQIEQVEYLVNEKIQGKMPIICEEMGLAEAKNAGSMGVFEHKYGEKVKVYSIGNYSKEICGGPHAKNTGELGEFKILKEESSSSGVRRIKAILK